MRVEKYYGGVYLDIEVLVGHNNSDTWSTSYLTETIKVPVKEVIELLDLFGVKTDPEKLIKKLEEMK